MVVTKNARVSDRRSRGKASHPHRTDMNVSLPQAGPDHITLLSADLMTLVRAVANLSICLVTLFGASHGLNLRIRFRAGSDDHVIGRSTGTSESFLTVVNDGNMSVSPYMIGAML